MSYQQNLALRTVHTTASKGALVTLNGWTSSVRYCTRDQAQLWPVVSMYASLSSSRLSRVLYECWPAFCKHTRELFLLCDLGLRDQPETQALDI